MLNLNFINFGFYFVVFKRIRETHYSHPFSNMTVAQKWQVDCHCALVTLMTTNGRGRALQFPFD